MSWLEHLLSSELIYRMGYALFHSLWQGVLVALLLAGALAVIPRTKSSLRYWCGCIALFALPVLFCATAVLVSQRENVIGPIVSETTTVAMDSTVTEKADSSISGVDTGRIDEPVVSAAADIEPAEVPASATSWRRRLSNTVEPWTGHVVLCWFVGVFAMSVWNLGGWIAVRRLRCIGISTAPERFVAMLGELAGRLGVKHPVRLLQSAVVQSPMTIGWLKPVILVPASILCELSPRQIELIIAHELAHIRRFDYLVNLLQTVVETLLFHHPAVWWISHKIRSERECCCDDAVVKLTSDELNYAKALTAIADLRRNVPQLAVAASGGSLLSRIQRILGLSNKKTLSGSTWLASLLALVICIAAAVSIVNAAAAPPRDATSQKLIIGTWKSTALPDRTTERVDSIRMTFEADGSGSGTTVFQDGRTTPVKFSYRFERRRLLIGVDEPGDDPEAYRWNIRKNKLRLRDNKGDMEFERVENPDETVQSQIVGTWEHVNSVGDNADQIKEGVWTFNGDGTFMIEGKDKDDKQHVSAGKYRFEEDTLYFTMGDEKAQTVAMLEGENLTIVFAGTKYTLRKKTATVDSAERSAFLGTWDMIEGTGSYAGKFKSVTVVFDADGRWTLESVDSKGQKDSVEGKYTSKGGRAWFRENDDIVIELDAERMTISENDSTFTFKKRDDAETVSDEARPWVGSWRAEEVWDDGVKKDHVMNLELNADGTCSFLVTIDGVGHTDSATYSVKGNRIIFEGGQELDPSVIAVLEGDTLTISGSGDRAVLKKYEPRISPLVGSWSIAGQGIMTIGESGSVTMQRFNGDAKQGMIVHSKDGKPILRNSDGEYSIKVSGDLLLMKEIGDADAGEYPLKRIMIDERFVGSWKSKEFTGSIDKQITVLFLTLKDASTFVLLGEGEDAGEPIKGFYQTDGDILTLHARSSDQDAIDFIKSARYDSGTIRLAIGGGAAVLSKVIPNPFDGGEHPMFRAELISSTNGLGNKLDLDTGESVSAEKWEQMAEKDRAMFELTISLGKVKLTSSNRKAKMLPVRDAGMNFAKAGASAVKYLPSLEKSRLRGSDYKGGIFLAVLTDRGNLAVVQMMTPTGEDQTPVGWSLAQIHKDAGEAPTVELTQTDPVEKETVEIKSRRVTIPDADTKNVPTILDLAGGDMLPFPEDIEGVDLLGHFTKLGKGDLLFDRLFAVLRGGSAQIWKDGQWTPFTPEDRQADATAYKLPESLPCRLLVTTGDGKQFDVNALARTTDGGIEIEYKPLDPADSTRDESVQIQASRATLPDFNKQQILLDLAGGNTILVPGILNDDEATRTLFRELKKGDLAFDDALVVLRGGTAYLWDGKAATALMAPPQDKFNLKGYELPSIPCRFLVTTGDGKQFDVTVLAHTEDGGIEIEYKPIGVRVDLPADESVQIQASRATLPDLDKAPGFLDLATGEMVGVSEDVSEDQIRQLTKGDLGFESDDNEIGIIRGGTIYLWDGVQAEALESKYDEDANTRGYELPSVPCRLLATTGDGKQFDVTVLAKTEEGGLEIEYKPIGVRVDLPADESVQIQNRRATLPDLDKQPLLLDLATGETTLVPKEIATDEAATVTYLKQLTKGDLGFDRALMVFRDGTASLWDGGKATHMKHELDDEFDTMKVYELPGVPCRLLITTGDGKQFDVKVLAKTKDGGLEIEFAPVGVEVTLPSAADKSAPEISPGQPEQPLPAISIAPSIETVGELKDLRIMARAINAYGSEKIVKDSMWEIRTADNSKRVAQIRFDWPWPKSPETTPLDADGKPPWLGWGHRSGVFNLTPSQLRRTGRLDDGVYLLAWMINGTRQSNVCHFRINRRHEPANEPLLKLSALPPAPHTTRNGRLVPPRRLLSLRYTRRTDKDPVINNDQVAFATLNVDGRDHRLKMMVWTGPVGPPKVGGHMTYLLDMGNYEPAIEPDKPHLVIAKIGNQQSNDVDLTPVAAGSPAWDVAAAKLGPPAAARIAIRGRVIGSDGKGAANYTVYVEHEDWKNNTGDLPVEKTDKDGFYAFYNLPAGLYDVFANPVGKGQPMVRITGIQLTEKKPVEMELDFEHKFTFSGRVTDAADQPVSGRDVMATWKSPDGKAEFNDFATTDADGRYTLGSPFPVAAYVGLSGTGPQPKPHRKVQEGRKDVDFQTARADG